MLATLPKSVTVASRLNKSARRIATGRAPLTIGNSKDDTTKLSLGARSEKYIGGSVCGAPNLWLDACNGTKKGAIIATAPLCFSESQNIAVLVKKGEKELEDGDVVMMEDGKAKRSRGKFRADNNYLLGVVTGAAAITLGDYRATINEASDLVRVAVCGIVTCKVAKGVKLGDTLRAGEDGIATRHAGTGGDLNAFLGMALEEPQYVGNMGRVKIHLRWSLP